MLLCNVLACRLLIVSFVFSFVFSFDLALIQLCVQLCLLVSSSHHRENGCLLPDLASAIAKKWLGGGVSVPYPRSLPRLGNSFALCGLFSLVVGSCQGGGGSVATGTQRSCSLACSGLFWQHSASATENIVCLAIDEADCLPSVGLSLFAWVSVSLANLHP